MITDFKPLQQAIVRITDKEKFVGVGLLLTPAVVVTCAHVVAKALGADPGIESAPAGEIRLNRPFVNGGDMTATVMYKGWFPRTGSRLSDIAFLSLNEKIHAPTIWLSIAEEFEGCTFKAWVGPEGHETHLIDIKGEIGGEIGNGRYRLDVGDSSYKIRPGSSGAPAADIETGRVLGLIAQEELDETKAAGFLIPATHLRQAVAIAQVGLDEGQTLGLNSLKIWVDRRYQQNQHDRRRVHNFVSHYAGVPENPMPFAGRAANLQYLDTLLSQDQTRFLLLCSEAARGKSALLVHWLAQLVVTKPDISLIFVPISIRFNTSSERNGLRLMHSAVCDLFNGLRFLPEGQPSVEQYRDGLFQAWQRIANRPNQRYLLVVDGIDEAANEWFYKVDGRHDVLLPTGVPQNLHILVSARYKPGHKDGESWLTEIRIRPATALELRFLAKPAMAEAVIQLGYPLTRLAEKEAFLDELYELTDRGDPLLLALWIGQIWLKREEYPDLNPADLRRLKPGLNGFFDYWLGELASLWQGQDSSIEQGTFIWLMHILAFAHGPLPLSDLMAVLNHLGLTETVKQSTVYSALCAAHRLVAKVQESPFDPPEVSSFILVHPRLNDYIEEQVTQGSPDRSDQIPRAYLAWGKEVINDINQNKVTPEACPVYLLQHYTEHLVDVEDRVDSGLMKSKSSTGQRIINEQWLALMEGGWHQAWEAYEGSWGGFLNDLSRVANSLRRFNQSCWDRGEPAAMRLAAELRVVLIKASICHLGNHIPAELMLELVKVKIWSMERAIKVTKNFANPEACAAGFAALATLCNPAQRKQLISDALVALPAVDERNPCSIALAALALNRKEEQVSMLRSALQSASAIDVEGHSASALRDLAPYLVGHASLLTEAREAEAQALEPSEALRSHNLSWPRSEEALEADRLINVAAVAEGEKRRALLTQAFHATKAIKDELPKTRGLTLLGRLLANEQALLTSVLECADAMNNQACCAEILLNLSPLVVEAEGRDKWLRSLFEAMGAIRVWDCPAPDHVRLNYLTRIAPRLTGSRAVLKAALEVVVVIKDVNLRAHGLAILAPHLAGDATLLQHALDVRAAFHDEEARIRALVALAPRLGADTLLMGQVVSTIAATDNQELLCLGIEAFADHFSKAEGALRSAMGVAEAITDPYYHVRAMAALAGYLPVAEQQYVIQRCVKIGKTIAEGFNRSHAFSRLAYHLEGEEKQQAVRVILESPDEDWRPYHGDAYAWAYPHLNAIERKPALHHAVKRAGLYEGEYHRANALSILASYLDGDGPLLQTALDIITKIKNNEEALNRGFVALAPHLSGMPGLLVQAERIAYAISDTGFRAEALLVLAPHLQEDKKRQAVSHIRPYFMKETGLQWHYNKVLAALPRLLEHHERWEVFNEVLAQAESGKSSLRKSLATSIKEFPDLAQRALAIARSLSSPSERVKATAGIVAAAPQLLSYELWTEWVDNAHWQREELLKLIDSFAFAAVHLCGPQETCEIARTVIDVGRWWP